MRVAKKALSNALTLAIRMRYCFWRFQFYEPCLCTSLYKCLSSPWLRKSNEVSPNFDLEQTEIVQMGKKKKKTLCVCVCVCVCVLLESPQQIDYVIHEPQKIKVTKQN
jgi:hypothetical protein